MISILPYPPVFHWLAALLYIGMAGYFWRTRWHGALLNQPVRGLAAWERGSLAVALVFHGLALFSAIFPAGGEGMHFGFAAALSMILWLAVLIYWVESLYARMEGLQMLGLPLAALCVLLPLALPGQHLLMNARSAAFKLHFLIAMLAYSLFTLAAMHALLMAAAERHLHRGRLTPLFAGLPPLLIMEALLFRLVHIAFGLLTLTLLSGTLLSKEVFGRPFTFNHMTFFALVSWLIFASLLLGRVRYGWRGRIAVRWILTGFVTLLLAYLGSRFVLEILLGRI